MKGLTPFILFLALAIYACESIRDYSPVERSVEGNFTGNYSYEYQGKNPIEGSYYWDTAYADTFTVRFKPDCDSIDFIHHGDTSRFRQNADHIYPDHNALYSIRNYDTLEFRSYFYSGTDTNNFYTISVYFNGIK